MDKFPFVRETSHRLSVFWDTLRFYQVFRQVDANRLLLFGYLVSILVYYLNSFNKKLIKSGFVLFSSGVVNSTFILFCLQISYTV